MGDSHSRGEVWPWVNYEWGRQKPQLGRRSGYPAVNRRRDRQPRDAVVNRREQVLRARSVKPLSSGEGGKFSEDRGAEEKEVEVEKGRQDGEEARDQEGQ